MSYIKGIDVSDNNGEINFSMVVMSGIEYVYMKATEGAIYIDNYMNTFYTNCKANNLKVGAYHFLTATSLPEKQALNFSNKIKNLDWDLTPMLDIEVNFSLLGSYVIRFINEFKRLTNLELGIYTYTEFISNLNPISNVIKNMKFWCANYNNNPLVLPQTFFTTIVGHQYSDTGRINGINGYVDLDAFKQDILLYELSGKWIKDNNGWKYVYSNGEYPKKQWLKIDEYWYYFKEDGYMETGWLYYKDKWYYLYSSGKMAIGWVNLDNNWFYFNNEGVMQIGWKEINGFWYYFKSTGVMKTGWLELNNKWYYLYGNGKMAVGWLNMDNKWYYFKADGSMQIGWANIDGKWYYFGSNGEMYVDKYTPDGYYVDSNGVYDKSKSKIEANKE